jgi:DNA-binding FadR family transcriptional regulator
MLLSMARGASRPLAAQRPMLQVFVPMKRLESPRAASPKIPRDHRLPQIEPMRLYRQIADLLSERIDDGVFPVGSLLPAERDLAQQLGVSRTSVREALIALEVSGKVSVRVGHGVQILEAIPRPGRDEAAEISDGDIGPIELMEARRHVELKTAELAAVNRSQQNLQRLEQAIELQSRAKFVRAPEYRAGDRNFHLEIAKAGGNAAYALIIANLWDYCCKPMFEKFEELLTGPDRLGATVAEHQRILHAIAARDRLAARKAMKFHLETVLDAFSRGLGAK